jgi:hypothetical protein
LRSFLHGWTAPSGPGLSHCWVFEITLRHTTLGTSQRQHTTLTRNRHPWPRRYSNPPSQQASRHRPTSETAQPLESTSVQTYWQINVCFALSEKVCGSPLLELSTWFRRKKYTVRTWRTIIVYICIRAYRVYALDLSVLTTLSLSFLSRYYADNVPCYRFCWLVFSFVLFRYGERFRKRSNSFLTVTRLRSGWPRNWGLIPRKSKRFLSAPKCYIGFGIQPVSSLVGNGVLFQWG